MTALAVAALPDIDSASLPVVYERARTALSECSRIDECQDWADKAKALASYAKQAKDETLLTLATRIKARAIRRAGELLKQIPEAKNQHDAASRAYGDAPTSRSEAAAAAGMSRDQKVTALRVASVPAADFERQVESEAPPTITELAEQGKKAAPLVDLQGISPAVFRKATEAGALLRALAEFAKSNPPEVIASGFKDHERDAIRSHIAAIDHWVDVLFANL